MKYLKVEGFQRRCTILSAYIRRRDILVTKTIFKSFYTSLLCAGTVGIIQKFLKLFVSLRICMVPLDFFD